MPKTPNYTLKAGFVIHPHGTSKFYSLGNITDEVAENWLAQYPADISKFETHPADWESRVKARQEGTAVEPTKDELKDEIEKLNELISQKDAEIETLKTAAPQDDGAKDIEIETLKSDLEAAKAENESLTKTIEELKAEVERLNAETAAETASSDTEQSAKKSKKKSASTEAE